MNAQNSLLKKIWRLSIILSFTYTQFIQIKAATALWQGKISIGGNTTRIHCDIDLREAGELYLQAGTLYLAGNYTGESGSKIFLPANNNSSSPFGFFDISGTATGTTEIIPGLSGSWDGSRIDLVKSREEPVNANTFFIRGTRAECNQYAAFMGHRKETRDAIWYLYGMPVLPLIKQLGNHTLLVNNNSATNGGYKFIYYRWYKDGELIREGAQVDNGGSYYTGGADLDQTAEYSVKATEEKGIVYFSCPYRYVPLSIPLSISVYPNPVPRNAKTYILAETRDLTLLNDAFFEVCDLTGQSTGKVKIDRQTAIPLNLPDSPGIYILKFRAGDHVETIKILVE